MGCSTHLAINLSRNIKINEVQNYGEKKSGAREGVDLSSGQVSPNLNL